MPNEEYNLTNSYDDKKGIPPDKAKEYATRVEILLLRGEFLPAWLTIAEAHSEKHNTPHKEPITTRPIAQSNLSVRTINTLEEAGILKWGDLQKWDTKKLLTLPNFGPTTLDELRKELKKQIDL